MDSGILNLAWCQGYDGSELTYLDPDVLSYKCGRNLKTINTADGKQDSFAFKGNSIGAVAIHKINKHIAYTEFGLNPKITVYAYPTYNEVSVLEGGAEFEFQTIAFSESDYLASVSGAPSFSMVLWNYVSGTMLTSVTLSPDPIVALSFNKANWRQICVMTRANITLWNTEQCNNKFVLLPTKIKLPPIDDGTGTDQDKDEDETMERCTTKMSKYAVQIPDSSVAGLVGQQVEQLDEIKDLSERVVPVSLTWLPTGDFYVGCDGGELFMVDSEMMKVRVLYTPPVEDTNDPFDRGLTAVSRGETDMPPIDASPVVLKPGSLKCLSLHQTGLYAAGNDGHIRKLDVSGEEMKIVEDFDAGCPVTTLCFNTTYQKLTWGSPDGQIKSYGVTEGKKVKKVASFDRGNVVGVGSVAIGSDCSVSLRENGEVQVWRTTDGTAVSQVSTHEPGETIACSSVAQYAVVGTKGGQLCFIDLTTPSRAKVVHKHKLFKSPIKHLVFNGDKGTLLFVASDDNLIFFVDARPSKGFEILGYVALTGSIQSLATYTKDHDTCVMAAVNNNPMIFGSNLLYRLNITDDLIKDIKYHYKSPMCDIKEESCHMFKIGLRHAICGLAVGEGENILALDAATKKLICLSFPEPDKKLKMHEMLLNPNCEYPGHDLAGGNLLLSPHLKWLATYTPDGRLKVRSIGAMDRTSVVNCHEYSTGGVRDVAFSDDCQYILTAGYDGVVSCYHWNHSKNKSTATNSAKLKRDRNMELVAQENQKLSEYPEWNQANIAMRRASQVERERKSLIEQAKQDAQDQDEIYHSPPPSPRANATWLEQRHIDALRQENEHYSGVKTDLRSQIRDIRKTIQNMMSENGDLPEIEKLSRHEFDLDLEEQNRLQAEGDSEIKKVREDIEFENLAKMYLREKIKEECWDNMKVKGRALHAFNSSLEVSNFPLRDRPITLINMINIVSARRKIEIKEREAKKQIVENSSRTVVRDDEGEGDDTEEAGQEHPSISGSLGAKYGGANELFYNQFELHTREQKVQQIVLLEDAIHRIKETFNKEFDEVYSKKESEITKTKDKNKRIRYIIKYLDLEEEVPEPGMSIAEKPEQLLEVADSEITVEKFLTPEQRKKLEEEQKAEEERIAREKGDNARERALDMMMGGVLEIKKEDELKKDIPKPAFMNTKKEEEYNEEEVKLFKEYQKKVQELHEEREKYRKQLETELRKIQATIQENLQAFDDALNVLFMRKIKVMMVIYQEELKILRLRHSMLIQEEIGTRERDLTETLEHTKHLKQLAFEAVTETRKNVDSFRNEYDNLQAEDKYVDKSFRRDFADVSAVMVDTLYKQFKRRPRIMRYRAVDALGSKANNPFSDRPSSSMQLSQQASQMNNALEDLDKIANAPEGCDHHVWDRMCKLRRTKVDTESLLKIKSNILAEMLAFQQKRQDEDERLKKEIDDISQQLNRLKEDEQTFTLNLEVQLLLKQGQIEVDAGPFIRDFRDSVLIHRSVVEDLNHTIKQLGESKIASMVESKDFRKGIIQLEWEHKKMSMQMEDLQNKMKDIQFIKVTREIQAFLQEDDYDAKKAAEIATLEQTILLQKKYHDKNIDEKKKAVRDLHRNVKTKTVSNAKLDTDLLDLNVIVNERKLIEEVNVDSHQVGLAERRYQEIVQRRKLVDLAKAQAQEVAVLRAEVERLRMRTFPALVQVER